MKLNETVETLKAKAKQLVSKENIEDFVGKAKAIASKENLENLATKAKAMASKENIEDLAAKAKSLASREKLDAAKQCVKGLATEEGRSALVHRFSSLSSKNKVLIVCLLLAIILVFIKCVTFICGSVFGSAERVSLNGSQLQNPPFNLTQSTLSSKSNPKSETSRTSRTWREIHSGVLQLPHGISVDLRKLSNESLDEALLDSSEVPVGTIFDHSSSPSIRIMNVIESGVLVHYVKGRKTVPFLNLDLDAEADRVNKILGNGDYNKIIHIVTDPVKYADGNELKAGIYVRTGSYKYKSRMGLRKVESYLDISSEEMEKKISEYRHRLAEVKAKKLISSEGKALDVDLDIKSICGFVMGGTPSQNWHLFEQSKHTQYHHKKGYQQYHQTGTLINPFRQFKEAKATYTFYDGVPEHLYEVELETESFDLMFFEKELKNVKSLLEKKFRIKMEHDPHPYFSSSRAYIWKGNKGEELRIQESGLRLLLILSSNVVNSMDEFEAREKKRKEEESKIMPADSGIEAL